MARKRAKKKTAARKRSSRTANKKPTRQRSQSGILGRLVRGGCVLCLLTLLTLAATYHFGSFELRDRMVQVAERMLHLARTQPYLPEAGNDLLNKVYDTLPTDHGLVVDAGELGHDGGLLLAGIPKHNKPLRVLHNQSYINLFSEAERQSRCVGLHLSSEKAPDAATPGNQYFSDSRINGLKAAEMQLGKWIARPIIPANLLGLVGGEQGAREAALVSHLVPMDPSFERGAWSELMELLVLKYPKRFGELWIYAGPVGSANNSKQHNGIPIPDGFYVIALNLTEAGGLRAISFLLPHEAADKPLTDYLCSIERIESATGFNFLPELSYDAREPLRSWVSPALW